MGYGYVGGATSRRGGVGSSDASATLNELCFMRALFLAGSSGAWPAAGRASNSPSPEQEGAVRLNARCARSYSGDPAEGAFRCGAHPCWGRPAAWRPKPSQSYPRAARDAGAPAHGVKGAAHGV